MPRGVRTAWRDISSFSQKDRERIPNAYDIQLGAVRLTVVRNHIDHKGRWIARCEPWFDQLDLCEAHQPAHVAQRMAIDALRVHMMRTTAAIKTAQTFKLSKLKR